MKIRYNLLISCAIFLTSLAGNAQDNSPWRTITKQVQTVSGVYISPGCHEYSLTGGQGFSVYIKNDGISTANVTGLLVAKTVCGNDVTTRFNVTLDPGQVSNGSDFNASGNNGQTSVVTPTDCKGVRYWKIPNSKFINRIKTVIVTDLKVTPMDSGSFIIKPSNRTMIKEAVKRRGDSIVPATPAFDSLAYFRDQWNSKQDSLNNEIYSLKTQNGTLSDSINSVNMRLSSVTTIKDSLSVTKPVYPITFAFQAGIGWDKLPIIVNDSASPAKSTTGTTSHPVIQIGCIVGFFPNAPLSLEVSPFLSYGADFLNSVSGHHFTYGGTVNLLATLSTQFKLVAQGNYTARNGTCQFNYSQSDYNYDLFRYGGGLRYTAKNNKFWIQPGVFWESPTNSVVGTPATVINIEAQIVKNWQISLNYGKNYFVSGTLTYPNNFYPGTQDYFGIRILRNIRIK